MNSICASKLWYIISVPPQDNISFLQKVIIDFIWQRRHWVKSDRIYLYKSYGGLGLVNILSRLHAFRLRFIHEYLYYDSHSSFRIANIFFRRIYNFGYFKSCIPPFYQRLMNTWSLFSHQKVTPPSPLDGIPSEPLWYNSYVTHKRNIITDTVIQQFISLGITQVKHLCEIKSHEPQVSSKRILESLKLEITATYLPQHWNDALHTSSRWETDSVIKHVTDIIIYCEKSKLVSLKNPPKKGFYMLAFDYWFSYDDHDPRVWCDILNFEIDRKVYFNNIYDCMLTNNECDLIWKIRHGAIPTGRFLYGCKYLHSPNCNYCGELADLTHIFVSTKSKFNL